MSRDGEHLWLKEDEGPKERGIQNAGFSHRRTSGELPYHHGRGSHTLQAQKYNTEQSSGLWHPNPFTCTGDIILAAVGGWGILTLTSSRICSASCSQLLNSLTASVNENARKRVELRVQMLTVFMDNAAPEGITCCCFGVSTATNTEESKGC